MPNPLSPPSASLPAEELVCPESRGIENSSFFLLTRSLPFPKDSEQNSNKEDDETNSNPTDDSNDEGARW